MNLKLVPRALGIDPRVIGKSVKGLGKFHSNRREFRRQAQGRNEWPLGKDWPRPADRFDDSGVANGQYFHQDLYVAQQIFEHGPTKHLDIGSRMDGFVAHVAAFRKIDVVDIRPLATSATNITFTQRDLMLKDPAFDECTDSLSCLHTLEHFGLGRYGDPVNYDGYLHGWDNLAAMLKPGGRFYFSVPISREQRIEFDAHRLFGVPHLLEMIEPLYRILQVALVDDLGELHRDVDVHSAAGSRTFDVDNGCIIFVLEKI